MDVTVYDPKTTPTSLRNRHFFGPPSKKINFVHKNWCLQRDEIIVSNKKQNSFIFLTSL